MAIHQILTDKVASITDLKRDPMGVITSGATDSGAIAILNRNQPAFYCVTPEMFAHYQTLMEDLEDLRLANEVLARVYSGKEKVYTLEEVENELNLAGDLVGDGKETA